MLVWQVTEEQGQSRDPDGHTETQLSSETALGEPKVESRGQSQQPEIQHPERMQGCLWGQRGWTQWEKVPGQASAPQEKPSVGMSVPGGNGSGGAQIPSACG